MYSFHHINLEAADYIQTVLKLLDTQLHNFGQIESKFNIVAQDLIETCHLHHGLRSNVRSIKARLERLCGTIMMSHHHVIEQLKCARQLLVEEKFNHFNECICRVHIDIHDNFEAIDSILEQFSLSFYVAYPWSLSAMNVIGPKVKDLKEFGNPLQCHLDNIWITAPK